MQSVCGPKVSPLDSDQDASPLDSEQALSPCTRPTGSALWIPGKGLAPAPCVGAATRHPAHGLRPLDSRQGLALASRAGAPPCTRGRQREPRFSCQHDSLCFFMAFIINFDDKRWFLVHPSVMVRGRSFRSVSFCGKSHRFGDRSVSEKVEHLAGVFGLRLRRCGHGRCSRLHVCFCSSSVQLFHSAGMCNSPSVFCPPLYISQKIPFVDRKIRNFPKKLFLGFQAIDAFLVSTTPFASFMQSPILAHFAYFR